MDAVGNVVNIMKLNRQERERMIEDLQTANAHSLEEIAERRRLRELNCEYFDDPIIKKSLSSDYDPAEAVAEQEYQQRQSAGRQVSMSVLEELADIVGEQTGKTQSDVEKLKAEIAELRNELAAERNNTREASGGFFKRLITR